MLVPADGVVGEVCDVVTELSHILLDLQECSLVLGEVEAQDTCHTQLQQAAQVIRRHWAEEAIGEGLDALSDMCESRGFVGSFFEGLILIDTLLDEDTLKRSTEVLLFLLREEDLQLFAEEELRALYAVAQELADGREERLLLVDDAAVG